MYKILLADDEGVALDSLKYMLLEQYPDTCDIRCARTARQIFELFPQFAPDIVFLNVQMPGIHGIYSIRKLHAIHPESAYIVVSHTRKTNYQREGSYMGITAYLKKPLNHAKVTDAFLSALSAIEEKRSRELLKKSNKEKLQTAIAIIENGFITELLLKDGKTRNLAPYLELLNIYSNYGWIMILDFFEKRDGSQPAQDSNPVGSLIQFQNQITMFRTIVRAFFPGALIGPALSGRVIVFVSCRPDPLTQEEQEFRSDRADHMLKQLQKKMNLSFTLRIGKVQNMDEIHEELSSLYNS